MRVNYHRSYHHFASQWTRCRHVLEGEDAVKAAGESYLPRLTGQSDESYDNYILRTSFYGATFKTMTALTGMTTRKPPKVEMSDAMREWAKSADRFQNPLWDYTIKLMEEKISTGRVGVLVDRLPLRDDSTLAQESPPYLVMYPAEEIINWHYTQNNVLDMVTLREVREVLDMNLITEEVEIHRILMINENGHYVQEVYAKGVLESTTTPKLNNRPMKKIPFWFVDPGATIQKPPLYDIVNLNLRHYRLYSDYTHLLHFAAIPTLVITGVQLNEGEQLPIGSEQAMVFSNPEATANWIKAGSEGAGPIKAEVDELENRMAAIGAQILQSKVDRETAQAAQLRNAYNTAFLVLLSADLSAAMTKILNFVAEWLGLKEEVGFILDTDFNIKQLPAAELQVLTQAYQSGAITLETYIHNLERGEYLPPNVTVQEEVEAVKAMPPSPQQQFDLSLSSRNTTEAPPVKGETPANK